MNTHTPSATSVSADTEVINDILMGNHDRFAELVERYQRTLYGIAWSRLRQGDAAEDVVQETFLQAFRYLPFLRDTSCFAGWLSRIARNLATSAARRSTTEPHLFAHADEEARQVAAPGEEEQQLPAG